MNLERYPKLLTFGRRFLWVAIIGALIFIVVEFSFIQYLWGNATKLWHKPVGEVDFGTLMSFIFLMLLWFRIGR